MYKGSDVMHIVSTWGLGGECRHRSSTAVKEHELLLGYNDGDVLLYWKEFCFFQGIF